MFASLRRSTCNIGGIFSRGFRSIMDGEDEFFGSLAYSHQKLNECISRAGPARQDEAVIDYLRTVKYPPVTDFQKGLEWFNVSEPLSFTKHLKGKVVVLDFFTYCCINCMHILPELKDIEEELSVEDGLVVIGVHSAKFENEKLSKNILAAVQRYNISHPVVNDSEMTMWRSCDVHCWPTMVLLGPHANPLVMLMGEGHKEDLLLYIRNALSYYKERNEISNHKLPVESAYHLLPELKGPLLFPGKIASYFDGQNNSEILGISDTGNNRILVVQSDGTLINQVGSSRPGFKDGSLEEAQFNAPQGLAFQNNSTLFVADTENHAIRKIDLINKQVTTVAGTGEQGHDRRGGNHGQTQPISSPWDVCIFSTPDLNTNDNALKDVLIIAMAGTHQIWALFLDDTVWWKNNRVTAGTCINIAGSGREENKNNQYPHASAFAQPSGLALCAKNKEVYIADSESSSVRRLSLVDGKVTPVVGGDRNPQNLFAFGDRDGKQYDAKLQHLLGLAMSKLEDTLFVADTYNHKIKKVDIASNTISTINVKEKFNEPAGLCISSDGKKLYIADTNNHCIKILQVGDNDVAVKLDKLDLKLNAPRSSKVKLPSNIIPAENININSKGGKLIITLHVNLQDGLGLTADAPQNWTVQLPSASWSCVPNSGSNVTEVDVVISIPPSEVENNNIHIAYNMVTCIKDTCLPKSFAIQQPVSFSPNASTSVSKVLKVAIDQSKIVLQHGHL